MNTTELKITGMTCDHCVHATTKALQNVPGVETVKVTLHPGAATVQGQVDPAALIAAVKEEGYEAEVQH